MRNTFYDALSKCEFETTESEADELEKQLNGEYLKKLLQVTVALETELCKQHKYPEDYAKKARSLMFNLNNKKNPELKVELLLGMISV